MIDQDVFSFIKSEETAYQTMPVAVAENYEWNMWKHIITTILYKNSQYLSGKNDNKPFKNIIRPILNFQYRAEGFDVKDIQLFVNSPKDYYKSFLIRKFHDKWARENEIDSFIDELVESYVDFGGALVKNLNTVRPEVVPLQRLAFCDQTDLLAGPICEKHYFSPDKLKAMEAKGWKEIETVITLSQQSKRETAQTPGKEIKTPGKYIEIYELHGVLPGEWLDNNNSEKEYVQQIQIVAFYKDKDVKKSGLVLFNGKEQSPYKLIVRDKIYGRALGMGGAEEIFEPQVWVNYDEIHKKNFLDAASKVILQTSDPAFANRNKIQNMENLEITVTEPNARIEQIPTTPVNLILFEKSTREWEENAKSIGATYDPSLGKEPPSGTPFSSLALQVQQGLSLHEYRKGKLATFLDEIYRDWIIPHLAKEVSKGKEFIAELDVDELRAVADSLVVYESNKIIKERILNGELIDDAEIKKSEMSVRETFEKGGNKKFIEILKGEFEKAPIDVYVNIVGKQKDLAAITEKLVNVFRQIISAPQILDDPRAFKLFNQILESSGLSPIDYQKPTTTIIQPPMAQPAELPVRIPTGMPKTI